MRRERCRLKESCNMALGEGRGRDRLGGKDSKEGIKQTEKRICQI